MTLKLAVTTNGDELVLQNARYSVGRSPDNDLRLRETYISGYHAELTRQENGDYALSDLASSNGTFLNGHRIEGGEVVKAGDTLEFGIVKVAVEEHRETLPRIVPLREPPGFASKKVPQTAPLDAVEPKTGAVATAAGKAPETQRVVRDASVPTEGFAEDLESLRAEIAKLTVESARLKANGEEFARENGRFQAELTRESAERSQLEGELVSARERSNLLVDEVESLKDLVAAKERELVELERANARTEIEEIRHLKHALVEASAVRDAAEERAAQTTKEKLTLSGSFDRLKERLAQIETALQQSKTTEEELVHDKDLLTRRLEKAEAGNSELAARIEEEAMASVASRHLIETLERQLRENECEAARREQAATAAHQADLSRAKRQAVEDERIRLGLEAELARNVEARRRAEELLVPLDARIVALESEVASTRTLLQETEKRRGDLATRLDAETALVATHLRSGEVLREELDATVARHRENERELMRSHDVEIDLLSARIVAERDRKESLAVELRNTREGFSDVIRRGREDAARTQAKLVAASNAKLSAIESDLSESIRSREETEAARHALEEELNQREGDIERLNDQIEDLDFALAEETEARRAVLRELATTREGFSCAIRAYRFRVEDTASDLQEERLHRGLLERELEEARTQIAMLATAAAEGENRHSAEIREWETRYESLREERMKLVSENAELGEIRDQIRTSLAEKRVVEKALVKLRTGLEALKVQHRELESQLADLQAEREELTAALHAARGELESVQKRRGASEIEVSKLAESITAAEGRIQSLRKLEGEMKQVIKRHRKNQIVSRGDVFPGLREITPTGGFSQEDFYRKLIAKLDLIDDLAKRYENKWLHPKVAEQLATLKHSFIELLEDHSVRPFDLQPGTVLSGTERRRIKAVPLQNGNGNGKKTNGNGNGKRIAKNGHATQVVATIRPGYIYQNGSKDVIIRKAEVLVS